MLPVVRITVEVHHSKDKDAVCFFRIEYAKWESLGLASPYFPFEVRLGFRINCRKPDGGVNLHGKIETQILLTFLVVIDVIEELLFSLRVKGKSHASNRFHILAKTCSPGIGLTSRKLRAFARFLS